MTIKQLYEKKARVYKDLNDLRSRARVAGKLTPEDKESFDKWNKEYDEIEELIRVEEAVGNLENQKIEKIEEIAKEQPKDTAKKYSEAFENYVRFGTSGLTPEQNRMLGSGFLPDNQMRAATAVSTTTTAGGYTIPEGFSYELETRLAYSGPFADPAGPYTSLVTDSGNDYLWPTIDDTANVGYLLSESTDMQTSSTGFTFGVETLKAYVYASGFIPVTIQILQDSGVALEGALFGLLGERLGTVKNTACTTGTGSSQPEGATVGSRQGKFSASATAFTHSEMIDFQASVDPKYQMGPKVGWMLHQQILAEVRKLDASTTNYTQAIWQPSFAAGIPSTILGKQYWMNNAMASAMTTGQKIMLYGDFSKFVIRTVRGITLRRLDERLAEYLQVAFMGWIRFDSRVMQDYAIK